MNKEENDIRHREKTIIRTSIAGVVTNLFLAGFKALIGTITGSIAVLLDAVNNLSDVLSSVITIVGTRLAGKRPDKKHPLGHGRIEYISAMLVAFIILYAGITALIRSVDHILHPTDVNYSAITIVILAVAVGVKIVLGTYVKKKGKEVFSSTLVASGQDALYDSILSASVLVSALIYVMTGFKLEAYVGLIIAAFIIRAGIEVLLDTISDLLGRRADPELTKTIKRILNEEEEVRGAYDLFINNYGPEKNYASVHLELPDTMTVNDVDRLTRRVETKVYAETGVVLTGVGVYSYNTSNDEAARIRNKVMETVMEHEFALQFHGFFVDMEKKEMRFDVVLDFDIDPKDGLKILYEKIAAIYPDYDVFIAPDVDISD